MWATFKGFADSMFENVDDFAIVVFIIMVGNKLSQLLFTFLHSFMGLGLFPAQTVKISTQLFIFTICFIQLIGSEVLTSASAGIAIGVGYAFQPYIISVFNGLMIHNDNSIVEFESWLTIPSQGIANAKVVSIGLFNTELQDEAGDRVILSNSKLSASAITVHKEKRNYQAVSTTSNDDHNAAHYLAANFHHS